MSRKDSLIHAGKRIGGSFFHRMAISGSLDAPRDEGGGGIRGKKILSALVEEEGNLLHTSRLSLHSKGGGKKGTSFDLVKGGGGEHLWGKGLIVPKVWGQRCGLPKRGEMLSKM